KVRYRGEPVAAVAAVDDATARQAISLIKLTVRELPAYFTSEAALAPDAVTLHARKPRNLERDVLFELGSIEQGSAEAALVRGGAHSGYGVVTILYSGSMLYAIYDLHNVKYVGRRVLTNTPPCGAFRGHGTVDVRFAFESLLDQMAGELGLDPFAVRRANLLSAPTFTDNDLMVNSYGLPQCVDWVEQASGWRARKGKLPRGNGGLRKGLGFACSHYISGASKPVNWTGEPHATVKIKLDFDGSIVVLSGAADIG